MKWGSVAVPGWLRRVNGPIRLHHGAARLRHSGFGPLDVSETGPAYGNLGGGQQVAALQVWCSNQGGTAAGQLAEGLVVFSGAGGYLHVLGTLTPQLRTGHAIHIPFVTVRSIGAERVVTTEFFYHRLRRRLLPVRPRPHHLALERPFLQAGPDHHHPVPSQSPGAAPPKFHILSGVVVTAGQAQEDGLGDGVGAGVGVGAGTTNR